MNYEDKIDPILEWHKKSKIPEGSDHIDLSDLRQKPKWKIEIVEPFGRCLVAIENIKEGEIILVDNPVVVGPKQSSFTLCLGCYKELKDDAYKCSRCKWPMCGPQCEKSGYHPLECSLLKSSGYTPRPENFENEKPIYESILPLRCLLTQKAAPNKWEVLMAMESHDELRKDTELWHLEEENICKFLRKRIGLKKDCAEIHRVTGILDVNCHEIRSTVSGQKNVIGGSQDEIRVRGVYPLLAMMSHDCSSNSHHTLMENLEMLVVASRNIYKGQQISGIYTHLLSGVIERRKHLKYGKFFDCACKRCADPSEFGTYFSGIRCSKGGCSGVMVPSNPLQANNDSDFECIVCKFQVRCGIVNKLTNLIYTELHNTSDTDLNALEAICKKYEKVLHPNHFHLVGIKHSLSQLYGRVRGFLMEELNPNQMQRKIDCCRDVLEVLDRIDPGISRLRGLTLYELHAPLMLRANNAFMKKSLTKPEFLSQLEDCFSLLQNSVRCLAFEPKYSVEGQICMVARNSMSELRSWIKTVEGLEPSRFRTEKSLPQRLEELTLEDLLKKMEEYERP